jgi:hypothetical protein
MLRLFAMQTTEAKEVHSLSDLCIEAVTRMNPEIFRKSASKTSDSGALYERQWQNEFYRCCYSLLPNGTGISPDVGPLYEAKGYIDYFIDSKHGWGIELLREGSALNSHLRRFDDGGKYQAIPLNDWLCIDFRRSRPKDAQEKVMYVMYDQDYKGFTVIFQGKDSRGQFMGGQVLKKVV